MVSRWLSAVSATIALLVFSSSCATTRGELNLVPSIVENPATGPAVRIGAVEDVRRFELAPKEPSTPSLKGGEIEDLAITSRAIGRKRNAYGKALGDILLPEGRTVAAVARESATNGLRRAGYRVLAPGDEGHDSAEPVDVRIEQFWAWVNPGFWAMHIEFEARLRLDTSAGPLRGVDEFRGYVRLGTQMATTGAWRKTILQGLEDLEAKIGELAAP